MLNFLIKVQDHTQNDWTPGKVQAKQPLLLHSSGLLSDQYRTPVGSFTYWHVSEDIRLFIGCSVLTV